MIFYSIWYMFRLVQVYGLGTSPAAPLSSSASEGKFYYHHHYRI